MPDEPAPAPAVDLKNRQLAAFLAWLVPGLGHLYQGRKGKAILYATCVLGLYAVGNILGDGRVVYWRWLNPLHDTEQFRFSYVGQFFVGLAALPALIQATLVHFGLDPLFGGWMSYPDDQAVLNALHRPLGKLVEMATLYTTVAGLLNVLAIYDAYEGPAHVDEPSTTTVAVAAEPALVAEGKA